MERDIHWSYVATLNVREMFSVPEITYILLVEFYQYTNANAVI